MKRIVATSAAAARAALLAAALAGASALADEQTGFWFSANAPAIELGSRMKTRTGVELRFSDGAGLAYRRFSQRFETKLGGGWTLGSSPVLESSKSGDDWSDTYRIDLELNPRKFQLGARGPELSLRNRWEWRWKEGEGREIFHRLRHRSKLEWKLERGPFDSFAIADEIFYETDKERLTANRFYPAMVGFGLGEAKASLFLLYQSKRAGLSDDWDGEYILGAGLDF